MIPYKKFSIFYDAVMGDQAKAVREVRGLLKKFHPQCKNVLELACGTGTILKGLKKEYAVEGLDLSPEMLKIARKKLPGILLHTANMTTFQLRKKFDAIICVYDSINHLTKFSDWKRVFTRAASHLRPGGVFIFDVNTPAKLKKLGAAPPWILEFNNNFLIMRVACDNNALSHWDIKVFEAKGKSQFELHHEVILEKAFPHGKIADSLRRKFDQVKILDLKTGRVSDRSERLYFIGINK